MNTLFGREVMGYYIVINAKKNLPPNCVLPIGRMKTNVFSAKPAPKPMKKKACQFCKDGVTYIDYKDVSLLRKFVSDRGKIRARRVTGNCTQHQRQVAIAIRNAREMALLPYVGQG